MVHTLEHVEDMSPATLEAGVPWDFETFPEYLDSVERRGSVINYSAYLGHTALRLWVMGDAGYEREATDDELHKMQAVLREAVEAGAAGFASSSSATHYGDGGRPVPSRLADVHELEVVRPPWIKPGAASSSSSRARRSSTRTSTSSSARSAGRSRGRHCSRSRATRGTRAWPS